jgi:hypothetical protein
MSALAYIIPSFVVGIIVGMVIAQILIISDH